MEQPQTKNTFISSSILISLSIVFLALIGYVGYLLFSNNILPISMRIIVLVIFIVLGLMLLLMGLSEQGNLQKFFGIFLNSVLLLLAMLAILYIRSGLKMLQDIQSGNKADKIGKGDSGVDAIDVAVHQEGFILYIAGNDNFGALEDEARTDVNIIVALNPKTRQIIMVSMPRDSYFPIPGEGNWEYDKLTHAGNYGVGTSIRTLENALDIKINYFVKMNFSSFMDIIDAVGGIDVDNPDAFTSSQSGKYYPSGEISLSSDEALDFVRERYNLPEGDFSRQRNQGIVIKAVFEKVISTELLTNFQGIINTVAGAIETNMPASTIMDFVNFQLDNNKGWKFQTMRVSGEDRMDLPSYAMPGYQLYMFVPYEDNIRAIHDAIQGLLDGSYIIPEGEELPDNKPYYQIPDDLPTTITDQEETYYPEEYIEETEEEFYEEQNYEEPQEHYYEQPIDTDSSEYYREDSQNSADDPEPDPAEESVSGQDSSDTPQESSANSSAPAKEETSSQSSAQPTP